MLFVLLLLCCFVNVTSYDLFDELSDETLSELFNLDIEDMEFDLSESLPKKNPARDYGKAQQALNNQRKIALRYIKEGRNKINSFKQKAKSLLGSLKQKQKKFSF
ncbi:hypothetical protein EHI8A_014180 [Entamoeba histolytica HM-1:IMSS-B]|uniref:Uncharacterized protein n=6 Tax=Entamoeba histolytica TaxID=5759 RepID=B1N2Q0_ENTH1|nr:hypothetical protein EHI_197560 [Entamoeba histolytica HM-1:IMSS]EMD49591.1 Hypothetical protein EHI5A_005760 [Entamoeba histolytica KU27]EMH77836.1 hypothetical protein EHI8A_014180 [Entamoeba histolytica HM-1:IMSS-B]EMS13835.1 hypothetical protein KM1_044780 [Entamoeba histolytica HM-3:IMSS]ENY62054.1 hypothetical protein EHI7A_018280 [Entamoeba histolytica HM-1:IMSS-A]BAN40004.1 hypothetical protein [Entamoeba histolytica]|eukprot:XP_001913466.1 hypothetical protein EHI_197560 [Entamoeba histolytica HM-1:IMSS]